MGGIPSYTNSGEVSSLYAMNGFTRLIIGSLGRSRSIDLQLEGLPIKALACVHKGAHLHQLNQVAEAYPAATACVSEVIFF